jgi:hypothetical protein
VAQGALSHLPGHLWSSIANFARTQNAELLNTLHGGFELRLKSKFLSV